MKINRFFYQQVKQISLGLVFFSFFATSLYSQTEIGIAPGEFTQIFRDPTVSIQPVTNVTISVHGEDSMFVVAELDSFIITPGSLKIKTYYTLSISLTAPIRELSIEVLLVYDADGVLTQNVSEDFVINTDVTPSIIADFSADPKEGSAPLIVNFTNESEGEIIGYLWNFGDGETSNEQDPQHTYQVPGLYSVSLKVFNFSFQNLKTKENYIHAQEITDINSETSNKPENIYLSQNYPNPFNPQTKIKFYLPTNDFVEIRLYDITGKLVSILLNGVQHAGEHELTLSAENLSSGIYFYTMDTKNYSDTKRLIITK